MSDPHDDRREEAAFEEYLRRQSALSRRYREQADGEVPPQIERRVLEHARAAVSGRRSARSWIRWSAPLAVAASALLVAVIVFDSGVREATDFATEQAATAVRAERHSEADTFLEQVAPAEQPASVPSASVSAGASKSEEAPRAPAEPPASRVAQERVAPRFASEPPRQVASPAPVAEPVQEAATRAAAQAVRMDEQERPAAANAIQAGAATAAPPLLEPEKWLERIRELRVAGKEREAEEEWQRFRDAYPHHPEARGDPAGARE